MPFFAMPYRVLFHDTMAYGSHHYLANFKFQNIARETILFESKVNGQAVWEEQLKNLVLLTREAFSLNLAPVSLGQKVAIFLSYEEPTRSTVRLCFRVIREDGQPVSCGYQTMVCIHKDTQELVPAPLMVTQYLTANADYSLLEKLVEPSFAERLKVGGSAVRDIFPEHIVRLGKHVANAPEGEARPRIIDEALKEYSLDMQAHLPRPRHGIVFTFPGQGSYHPETLRELYERFPETAGHFRYAEEVAQKILGQEFLALMLAASRAEHDRLLAANPDMSQFGIYLAGALLAQILIRRGLQPELLVGHSIGELAALASAGVFSIDTGLELVAKRVLALRSAAAVGQMAAVSCSLERTLESLERLDLHTLEIAVVNHPKQTVLSGRATDLERLGSLLVQDGISLTLLESPFPFHSSHLAAAVEPFRRSLASYQFGEAQIPVYHCTEDTLYSPATDLAVILSRQFVRRLDFAGIVSRLHRSGFGAFVECGAGEIVTRLVQRSITDDAAVRAMPVAPRGESLLHGVEAVLQSFGVESPGASDGLVVEMSGAGASQSVREHTATPEERHSTARGPLVGSRTSPDYRQASAVEPPAPEAPLQTPVAIVAMGCVLPGAANPDQYWRNIKNGVSGIVDLTMIDPNARRDFMAGSVAGELNIVPDKTYTLLNGAIVDIRYDAPTLDGTFTEEEFAGLTRGQRLLALALSQSLADLCRRPQAGRMQCILGATADGSSELDYAAFVESLQDHLDQLDEPEPVQAAFALMLEEVCGYRRGDALRLAQYRTYKHVVDRFLPGDVRTYVVDSACSSSLYAVNLAIKALRRGEADLVLTGGVFAPGPANNTLFAQFRGLSPSGSRPFDKDADGVVFGDGAALLALKRLPEALADGDRVIAVIRGMGLSSDGKSPSINVPQSKGQILAVRRALQQSGIAPETIQYIEAHATATPVGDKVEIASLCEVFKERQPGLPKIELGSVKALIGHTGWVSGAASIIKLCQALQERTVPKQYNYHSPDPEIGLTEAPFTAAAETHPWPDNLYGYPRRAGINGFGFGGTNAHLVLEEFDATFHRRLCDSPLQPLASPQLAIVGVGSLFPAADHLAAAVPSDQRTFSRPELCLPRGKRLLPDVTEHMDASQFLVALAAEEILAQLPGDWAQMRQEIGIVLGLESKTERSIVINKRIFLDRLSRLIGEESKSSALPRGQAERVLGKLVEFIRRTHQASGPYTLPGLMPNIAASRVSSLFDFQGPNLVIDEGSNSLFQSLVVAEHLLVDGDCQMVLAGGVNALHSCDPAVAEVAFLLALTTAETARERSLPVLAMVQTTSTAKTQSAAGSTTVTHGLDYRGATGVVEFLAALDHVAARDSSAVVHEPTSTGSYQRALVITTPSDNRKDAVPQTLPAEVSKTYAYVQGTPIYRCTTRLSAQAAREPACALEGRNLLFLVDQPEQWSALRRSGALDALRYHTALPLSLPSEGSMHIDLASDAHLTQSLHALDTLAYDTIVAVKFLGEQGRAGLLEQNFANERGLLELLFAVCRHDYNRIREGQLAVVSLCVGAMRGSALEPYTGLTAGFLKSLARELPKACLTIVNTDATDIRQALGQVETELGQRGREGEVCYLGGRRHVFQTQRLAKLARDGRTYIDASSVVLATGGGRGVTAVLVEELLARYGCTVVAVGRTDLQAVPERIRTMEEQAFRNYETAFYQEELARDRAQKIPDLKRKFAAYQAVNELSRVIQQMQLLPGRFDYRCADLTDPEAIANVVAAVYQQYGRIDLVLHGAGMQISSMLTKKSLADFRRIIATKLVGLGLIYQAVERHRNGHPVHYHLLTSAFSYLGNDGQPDYGAANEALSRIAAVMDDPQRGPHWSAMGWLGWAGIGMTRGSEFAALAASRRLRGVTKEEGRQLFAEMMSGVPMTPINILLADGEMQYYGVALADAPAHVLEIATWDRRLQKQEDTICHHVTLDNAPFLIDHVVNGTPTMPASFLTCIVSDAAKQLRPDLQIAAYENTHYYRFVRVPRDSGAQIRVHSRVVSEDEREAVVHVQVLSDFVHKTGRVLQKDILHNETFIHMSRRLPEPPKSAFEAHSVDGLLLQDPYVMPESKVRLNGQFASMRDIRVGPVHRMARYKLLDYHYPASLYGYLLSNMICVDAFWRFGTVRLVGDRTLGVYVPERCGVMRVYFDYTAFDSAELTKTLTFRGTNPTAEDDLLHVGPIDVCDSNGNVLLVVERGVCRKFGEVRSPL